MLQPKLTPVFYIKQMIKSETPYDWAKNFVASLDSAQRIVLFNAIEQTKKIQNSLH